MARLCLIQGQDERRVSFWGTGFSRTTVWDNTIPKNFKILYKNEKQTIRARGHKIEKFRQIGSTGGTSKLWKGRILEADWIANKEHHRITAMYESGSGEQWSVFCKSYHEKLLVRERVEFPLRLIWVPKVLKKVCFSSSSNKRLMLTAENW